MITLITGGVKSGKSAQALKLAKTNFTFPASFIATAEAVQNDEEMRLRIRRHQAERAGAGFETIEEPLAIDDALSRARKCALVDCITVWVNNIMYHQREADFEKILRRFIKSTDSKNVIVVTNETGFGNIPFDETIRRYNLLLSEANKKIAAAAERVELLIAGLSLSVKG